MKFGSPSCEIIREHVIKAGGSKKVAENLAKSERIVHYWCRGDRKIDLANWEKLKTLSRIKNGK